jgi:hypothetical protein
MLIEPRAHVVAPTTLLQAVWSDAPNVQTRTVDVLRNRGPSAVPPGSRSVAP